MSQVQSEALFNIPVASWGRNGIATQIDVIQQHMRLSDVKAYEPIPDLNGKTADKITVGVTVSYQRVDSLFRRPVYYSGNITGYTGQDGSVEKMRFLGVGILTLKQTPVNSFSLGMIVIVDPTSNIPAIPMVIYTHRFNKGLELNVSLPQQVSLRQALSRNCWASFGTVISAPSAFFRYNSPEVPHDVNYTTVNLKTGPSVEYRFGKYFIAGINAGLWTPIQSRQFEHWTKSTNYFLDNKIETTPYVNFSLSVLPFF